MKPKLTATRPLQRSGRFLPDWQLMLKKVMSSTASLRLSRAELEGNVGVDPESLETNLLFGSPDTVIEKLKPMKPWGLMRSSIMRRWG